MLYKKVFSWKCLEDDYFWAFFEEKLTLRASFKKGKEKLLRFLQLARDAFLAKNFDRFIDS